jgi:hypothetical protein
MNMLSPGGDIDVVGTPFTQNDLYTRLAKAKSWRTFKYPAIFPDGTVLWEGRHNFESLMEKRDTQGSIIFSREILVKAVSNTSTIFPYSLVSQSFKNMDQYKLVNSIHNFPKKFKRVATGCDFAHSANVAADFSVFITLGVDEFNQYWLLNVWRGKGKSYNEQLAVLKQINSNFKPDVIYMEDNQMQSLFVDGAKEANLPCYGHTTGVNKYDLKSGLPGMTIVFEQNRFHFPRGDQYSKDTTDMMAMELASITWSTKGKLQGSGAHDDTVMALWLALKACNHEGANFGFAFF